MMCVAEQPVLAGSRAMNVHSRSDSCLELMKQLLCRDATVQGLLGGVMLWGLVTGLHLRCSRLLKVWWAPF
jgi:hypothetical protein